MEKSDGVKFIFALDLECGDREQFKEKSFFLKKRFGIGTCRNYEESFELFNLLYGMFKLNVLNF